MINYATSFLSGYRTPEWKLVRDFMDPERDELYHVVLDPEENINIVHDSGEEVRDVIGLLHQKILHKIQEINDPLLVKFLINKAYYR